MKKHLIALTGILWIVKMSLAAQTSPAASLPLPQHPNIIFILADDLGYGDLSVSGNPIIKTPNIDDLARHSIICTNGYAAYPICEPSRISILSGRYSDRTGTRMNAIPSMPKLDQPWLPSLLKTAGYTTGAIGKWHMGNFPKGMRKMGFDTWAITANGGWCDYWNYVIKRPNHVREPSAKRYGTDVLTDEAIKFVDQNSAHPFFLYLAYTAPHFPLEAPDDEVAPFKARGDLNSGAAIVYAMIQHLDKKVGELVAHLKEKGLYDNTIIVFTSDNGPDFGTWKGLNEERWNDSLAGSKGDVWEGGIKVPVFISWPAAFGNNPKPFHQLVDGIDWQPTLSAAAGVTGNTESVDGTNLLPRLLGQSTDPIPFRFWSYNKVRPLVESNGAMRDGDWKLVRPPIPEFNEWGQPADLPLPANIPSYQIFNIAQDPDEKHDLSAEQAARMQPMEKAFEQFFKDVTSGPDNADLSTKASSLDRQKADEIPVKDDE
jgi:arylsulfatase A